MTMQAPTEPLTPLTGSGEFYGKVYGRLYRLGYHSKDGYSHAKEIVGAVCEGHLPVKSALDIGCSIGWAVSELGKLGVKASGVDVAPKAIEDGRKKGLDLHLASATDLPFEDGQFELVMSTDCFEHLRPEDVVAAVDESWRVSSKYLAFKINPRADRNKMWKFLARTPLHLTLMPLEAWIALFERKGGKLIQVPGVDNEEFVIEKPQSL